MSIPQAITALRPSSPRALAPGLSFPGNLPGSLAAQRLPTGGSSEMPGDPRGGPPPLAPLKFAGPQELAALVVDFRRYLARRADAYPPALVRTRISDKGLGRLLDLAYRASLEKDEGRYTRLRLFVRSESPIPQPRLLVRFAEPVNLEDSGPLCQLAPAVGPHGYALCVCEKGCELSAEGIVALDDPGEDVPIGETGLAAWLATPGLIVRVAGPGELRVSETALGTYELSAGRIRVIEPFNLAIPVDRWLREHASAVSKQSGLMEGVNRSQMEFAAYALARTLWSLVLMTAAELQHGGAFAIVPGSTAPGFISMKYRATDKRLGPSAAEFFGACARTRRETEGAGFGELAGEWLRRKRGLRAEARALGRLSAVDGCVVVDRGLNLLGFGGHIQVSPDQARRAGRAFTYFDTREPRPESDLKRFGTRHLSAFQLCQAVQDCLVFVISQDGRLRVFASDAKHVYLFDALAAEVSYRDQC